MKPDDYTFFIDAFSPETIPMSRLADYMSALADLLGFEKNVHFLRLEKGSARLVQRVDAVDAPKVERRLANFSLEGSTKEVIRAFERIDELLVEDNAVGGLIGPSGVEIIPFPGRTRPRPLTFPAFRQDGAIEGQIVSVGGRDATAHVILQDHGITYTGCHLKRELAKELARLLYGVKVRLIGSGKWERHPNGTWKLIDFRVDSYQVLDESPIGDVLSDIRQIPGNGLLGEGDIYSDLTRLRNGDGEVN